MPVVSAPLNYSDAQGGVDATTVTLLPNGKVLAWGLTGSAWVLSPDAYGSYVTGSWRRVQDMPYVQKAGPSLVLNNGKLLVTCGEFGTSNFSNTQLFDPETERWTAYPNTPVGLHAFALMFDDGSVYGNVNAVPRYIPANSLPTQTASYEVLENLVLINSLLWESGPLSEGLAALTPGGFFVTAETNMAKPGSQSHALGSIVKQSETVLLYARRSALARLGELPNWWRLPSNSLKARWTSIGIEDQEPSQLGGATSVWYEPGAMCYMPKIGKVVIVDGVGSILSVTPNVSPDLMLPTLTRSATMPLSPLSAANTFSQLNNYGGVDSIDRNKTATQIAAQGTLTVSLGLYNSPSSAVEWWNIKSNKNFYVRCASNTKFMRFSYTTATAVGTNTYRFNGVTLRTYSGASWDGTITETGGEVTTDRPILTNMDQGVAVLPNGNLLIAGGTGDGGFNTRAWLATWDGVQPVAQIADETRVDAGGQSLPLPDGTVMVNVRQIYVPTAIERTPSPSAIPTITSAPSAIAAGGRFTLAGTQLTGIHQGGYFSEDYTPHTNIPIVRLTGSDGRVWFCSTRDYSYRGIEPGRASTCNVTVPFDVPAGTYGMQVVVNGCPSASRPITVTPQAHGEATFINFIP